MISYIIIGWGCLTVLFVFLFFLTPLFLQWKRKKIHKPWTDEEEAAAQGLKGEGPSPWLLAQMEAAGMNTTHERWEDFEARRRQIQESMGELPGDDDVRG
jgi:hypothetical protein